MSHPFQEKLAAAWPTTDWAQVTSLAAVSGGADSMALMRAMCALGAGHSSRIVVAHFNHRLRGTESDGDEEFVREQAAMSGLAFEAGSAESPGTTSCDEESARRARYGFLCQTARKWGARYVATAHTADDQAETILHRVLRGSGLEGLAGIPRFRQLLPGVALVRPLLDVSRSEVLDYLQAIKQPFREDATNAELRFTRNKLRLDLIPKLECEYNPRVKEALTRLGQLAAESNEVIADAVRTLRQQAVESAGPPGATIRCHELTSVPQYLVRQLFMDVWRACGWGLRAMTQDHWRQLAELVSAQPGDGQRADFPGAVCAERAGMMLRLQATRHSECGGSEPVEDAGGLE